MSETTPRVGARKTCLPKRTPYLDSGNRYLDPKNDVVFKLLLAAEKNRGLLVKLLTAVLEPRSPITSVEVLNPDIELSELGDKRAVLDIFAAFEDKSQVDIEMQARPHEALEERLVFYWAKAYTGQVGSGDPHTDLKPVIGVYFLDFTRLPTARSHSVFHISEDHAGFPLTEALELHFLELPKYAALRWPPDAADGDPVDPLVHWCLFLAAETQEEQEALAMTSPDIREAKNALDKLSADPKARKLAEDRLIWEWAYYQDIKGALRQGREEGREEERRRMLIRLLEKRFGALDGTVLERIATADGSALGTFADRILDAASVGEVISG